MRLPALAILALGLVRTAHAWDTNEWQFLESIQQANLRFFQEQKRGPYLLVNDTAPYDATGLAYPDYSSVAGVGFELTAICLGHYRGWISLSNAYEQVLFQLRAFNQLLSPDPDVFAKDHGWTYHTYWIDGPDAGKRFLPVGELSLLDHSLFLGGCIFVSEYFKGTEAGELAHKLYAETQWDWRPNGDYNFGYSENLLAVIESAEAPQHKKGGEAKVMWNNFSSAAPWPRTLQLYFWEYPHAWIDFRFRTDEIGHNHADIARDSILYMRQRAMDLHQADPVTYDMIGTNVWGWTAAFSSEGYRQMAPWDLNLESNYPTVRASDSGSVSPFALPPCMVYAPAEAMAAMKHIYEQFFVNGWNAGAGELPVWSDRYGFLNCFNTGQPWNTAKTNHWHGINAAIDYGPNVLGVENYLRGTTWRYFMQNPHIAAGMYTVGFGPPVWTTKATFENQTNAFGGSFGSWHNDATPVTVAYAAVSNANPFVHGYAVRILADADDEGGWIDLGGTDQRAQALLTFWVRAHTGAEDVAVGLKDLQGRENTIRLLEFTGGALSTNWIAVNIPLEHFCLTGNVTNDVWPGNLQLLSFAFLNPTGGGLDIDHLAFSGDTLPPAAPEDGFGAAAAGEHARVRWNPASLDRDVVGMRVWARENPTGGFHSVRAPLVPAYLSAADEVTVRAPHARPVRYAIQALDNAHPQNGSLFTQEKLVVLGRQDLDWNDGRNPNALGGNSDGYFGPVGPTQVLAFVFTDLPDGHPGWARRSFTGQDGTGHFIMTSDADLGDYAALAFDIRGSAGGEQIRIGLKDASNVEVSHPVTEYLPGGITTNWQPVTCALADFQGVDMNAVQLVSITHETAADIQLSRVGWLLGPRARLGDDLLTEAEHYTSQQGSMANDYKPAASNREVLGSDWGDDDGDFAEYSFHVPRELGAALLSVRYACNAGDGRALAVDWDDLPAGSIACTNTAGWGDLDSHFSVVTLGLSGVSTGLHKLKLSASGADDPVNLDSITLTGSTYVFRECEAYDTQSGSYAQDFKPGASGGLVLGANWGSTPSDSAVYAQVDAGSHTGAWFHLWYSLLSPTGRVVELEIDGVLAARIVCSPTPGWGDDGFHFEVASAYLGELGAGSHTVRLSAAGSAQPLNLDAFYLGPEGPVAAAKDVDGDGLSDRQEGVLGTSAEVFDSDGDGIGDGDELSRGSSLGQITNPLLRDTDGDEVDDYSEGVAGTDPWDTNSVLSVTGIVGAASSVLSLSWPAVSGRSYAVQGATGMIHHAFAFGVVADDSEIVTTNGNASVMLTNPAPAEILRVRVGRL